MENNTENNKIWHTPDEQPEFYPTTIASVDKSAILIDEHSKHFVPTAEAQEELKKKLQNYKRWTYLRNLVR